MKCLLLFFNHIWNGDFPNFLNEASIVSILKKGDITDCNNYRGISLINNGIKLITKVITNRISEYELKYGFIRPEQFGFRSKEECLSLYISLREIVPRRKFNNQETYLAFLNFKKAYDSVPIDNVLCKIYRLGIRRKCYDLVYNLYFSSKAKVKLDNEYSNSFSIIKKVQLKYPLSPILFNLFINYIFNSYEELGVSIDGNLCCGGLYTDDIVLCAPTRVILKRILMKMNKWAMYNNMTCGINKCATIVVHPDLPQKRYIRDPTFYLAGQSLPITDCYTYLGIPFDKTLSLKSIIKCYNNKVRRVLFSIGDFLRNSRIPLSTRCALTEVRWYNKWKSSNCIITSLVNNVPKIRKHILTKQSKNS